MLYSNIVTAQASYCCKFMETPRYLFEKEYGKEWFTRIGEFHGFAGLIKILATVARLQEGELLAESQFRQSAEVPKKTKLTNLQPNFDASTANTAIGLRSGPPVEPDPVHFAVWLVYLFTQSVVSAVRC